MARITLPGFLCSIGRFIRKYAFLLGILIGVGAVFGTKAGLRYSSTDDFCAVCHVHPHSHISWKRSTHFKNESGVVIHCVECHLPPEGVYYLTEKARLGIRDAYGTVFKDTESIDWVAKSSLEHAKTYTYDSACMRCHSDLYSLNLKPKGVEAHEYYMKNTETLRCINCHLAVGHYQEQPFETVDLGADEADKYPRPERPVDTDDFIDYTQTMPGSDVTFDMIAIKGGEFTIGSEKGQPGSKDDESPERTVQVSPFWMGEAEVSWREWEIFYTQTATRGKNEIIPGMESAVEDTVEFDAITGPTPPYGSPDQGWGRGARPAITMTHHAAEVYCEWLSQVTGKKFRLPTEAEWEYACRAGTDGAYYFDANPAKLTKTSFINRIRGVDTSVLEEYVWFEDNSSGKTHFPFTKAPNPWGLFNMLGNVKEFCADWYAPDTYSTYPAGQVIVDPKGPSSGKEHVIRGGSFSSGPMALRVTDRDHTYTSRWLMTDPQQPKSIWWYSDSKEVGFRVVRELEPVEGDTDEISISSR